MRTQPSPRLWTRRRARRRRRLRTGAASCRCYTSAGHADSVVVEKPVSRTVPPVTPGSGRPEKRERRDRRETRPEPAPRHPCALHSPSLALAPERWTAPVLANGLRDGGRSEQFGRIVLADDRRGVDASARSLRHAEASKRAQCQSEPLLACDGEILAEAYWKGVDGGLLNHPEHTVLIQADASISAMRGRHASTLEPCLMCMGTAMSFFLGRIVYAMSAPVDGATSVSERWHPTFRHPSGGVGCRSRKLRAGSVRPTRRRLSGLARHRREWTRGRLRAPHYGVGNAAGRVFVVDA